MTTQEFVKKEAGQYVGVNAQSYNYRHGFTDGITKGLEIAVAFRDWTDAWEVDYREQTTHTTSELLTIFLTEKYRK